MLQELLLSLPIVPSRFINRFAKPIEAAREKDATKHTMRLGGKANEELQKILCPYFLQRLKIDFLKDKLPPKHDFVVWTHISAIQRQMYEEYVNSAESAVASVLAGEKTSPLEAIAWLKKLCGHPVLVDHKLHGVAVKSLECNPKVIENDSSKLKVLMALVNRMRLAGHRTLIFSQSTKMLDIIELVLHRVKMLRIDGSTKEKERQRRVDTFNDGNDKIEVMLLSTKAAGIGLTLTGADRVIVYDPSWNPAEDAQAIDRCYRIGQTKEVIVFRLIAAGTVEEKMYEKQVHKDGLRRAVMTSTGSATTRYFDREELRKLFMLAPSGECAVLNKLKENGQGFSTCHEGDFISSHAEVIGVSSHDVLYSAASIPTQKNEGNFCRQNPFSTPQKVNSSTGIQSEATATILGRSKRVLMKNGETAKSTLKHLSSGKENKSVPTSVEKVQKSLSAFSDRILVKVNRFKKDGELPSAMMFLMNVLDDSYCILGKDDKLLVHEQISSIANELGWL